MTTVRFRVRRASRRGTRTGAAILCRLRCRTIRHRPTSNIHPLRSIVSLTTITRWRYTPLTLVVNSPGHSIFIGASSQGVASVNNLPPPRRQTFRTPTPRALAVAARLAEAPPPPPRVAHASSPWTRACGARVPPAASAESPSMVQARARARAQQALAPAQARAQVRVRVRVRVRLRAPQ